MCWKLTHAIAQDTESFVKIVAKLLIELTKRLFQSSQCRSISLWHTSPKYAHKSSICNSACVFYEGFHDNWDTEPDVFTWKGDVLLVCYFLSHALFYWNGSVFAVGGFSYFLGSKSCGCGWPSQNGILYFYLIRQQGSDWCLQKVHFALQ